VRALTALVALGIQAGDEGLAPFVRAVLVAVASRLSALEFQLLLSVPYYDRDAILAFLRSSLVPDLVTMHHGHHPEIRVDGDSATGTWYLHDSGVVVQPANPPESFNVEMPLQDYDDPDDPSIDVFSQDQAKALWASKRGQGVLVPDVDLSWLEDAASSSKTVRAEEQPPNRTSTSAPGWVSLVAGTVTGLLGVLVGLVSQRGGSDVPRLVVSGVEPLAMIGLGGLEGALVGLAIAIVGFVLLIGRTKQSETVPGAAERSDGVGGGTMSRRSAVKTIALGAAALL
jgi:hypothetical protein